MTPEVLSGAAAAATYTVGIAAEQLAIHRAAQQRRTLSEAWGEAFAADNVKPNLIQKIGRTVFAPLALSAGVAAGLAPLAWESAPVQHEAQPTLEVVIDHSGATGLSIDGTPAVNEINKVVNQLDHSRAVNASAFVTKSGTVKEVSIQQAAANTPFGDANLSQAVSLALDKTAKVQPQGEGIERKRNAGVLVITNGNSVGDVTKLEARSESQGGTPVFVVNVEGNASTTPAITHDLQALASKTHAKYWDARADNIASVVSDVQGHVAPVPSREKLPYQNMLRIFDVMAAACAAGIFLWRGVMTFNRGAKGE